jgi:hypothetical protein
MANRIGPQYQSPLGSGGNDGVLPKTYDPAWQAYVNLTPAQIFAFQSFPKDLVKYASLQRWRAEISGITIAGIPLTTQWSDQQKISALKQAFDAGAISQVSFFDADGNVQSVNAAAATAVFTGVVQFVQSTYNTLATLVAGINAATPTVTTRKQIDTAIAAVAPNSPSATNPSPT